MKIIGLESLTFGVDDVDVCIRFLEDYGLQTVERRVDGAHLCGIDGTGIFLRHKDDSSLPPALSPGNKLRKTTYGVQDQSDVSAIAAELRKDRQVTAFSDGSIESHDDQGFVLGFEVTQRKRLELDAERCNAPGETRIRPINTPAANEGAVIRPRSLSHVVYFVPEVEKAEDFYVTRLKFRCTDRLLGAGPFLQAGGSLDHHCLFLIQTPAFLKGCEHFTFHLGGPSEVLQAGTRFVNKGHSSFWGPGRHKFGSNWFWYFNSPLGCHIEYDADMDLHDESWIARQAPMSADASQLFLFQQREKWIPMGKPPAGTTS
jgi:catechol 2,3-dioxygenase-like lactoylglutathione lyase family enzyme